jgi:ribosome-associated translation inhibitor RaiA
MNMHVQTNTDRNIQASESLAAQVEAVVIGALGRFVDHVTRVEVHLSDENGAKGGTDDKRCMMEARHEDRPPTAVTHRAATVEQAIDGAAGKLARAIERSLARVREN